jgi:hypothetical protein
MHVEVMELHDGVMIAECCPSDVVALIALGFGVCFVLINIQYKTCLHAHDYA